MFTVTVVLVERFPPQTPAHLHHTCPPAALPSVHVSWNPQERMSALTQPTCVLSPDNQSHQAARGNRSPGHVSRRSLSCNRICSQAPTPPPPPSFHTPVHLSFLSVLQNQLIHVCILHISHHFLFSRHDKDGGQTCLMCICAYSFTTDSQLILTWFISPANHSPLQGISTLEAPPPF